MQFEKAFYSVPHRLIGTRVLAMGNSHTVRIFLDFEEVTSHQRASRPWEIKRKSEHAPPELEQYLNLTSEGLVQWAQRLGPSVGLVAELILADRAVDGLRPVRALIRLADTLHHGAVGGRLPAGRALRHAQLPQRQGHPRQRTGPAAGGSVRRASQRADAVVRRVVFRAGEGGRFECRPGVVFDADPGVAMNAEEGSLTLPVYTRG